MSRDEYAFLRLFYPSEQETTNTEVNPHQVAEGLAWSVDRARNTRNDMLRKYNLIDF
jgi:hypothetical protein